MRAPTSSPGIVRREAPLPATSKVYDLTDWGTKLEPVIIRLGRWHLSYPP